MDRRPKSEGEPRSGAATAEESMSIEETNKLRASLGLPPLKLNTNQQEQDNTKKRKRETQERDVAELQQRVQSARERRRQQELLSKTKTLGEKDAEIDDVMAWVNKIRAIDVQNGSERDSNLLRKNDTKPTIAAVNDAEVPSNLKVKMALNDLEAGEEMILTLEDRAILNEKGLLDEGDGDTLENVTTRENRRREKAFRESRKSALPLWEEDGLKRPLLHKYDEEEEEDALDLNDINSAQMQAEREKLIREKLAASSKLATTDLIPIPDGREYTAAELESIQKPKKKKERKLKKKALTAEDIAEIEVTGTTAQAIGGATDLGSREERERRAHAKAEEMASLETQQRSKFETALQKANIASQTLRLHATPRDRFSHPSKTDLNLGGRLEDEDDDEDLARSLAKARQLAQIGVGEKGETVMMQLAQRRRETLEQQTRQSDGGQGQGPSGLTFTDIGELTRAIAVKQQPVADEDGFNEIEKDKDGAIPMAVDESISIEEEAKPQRHTRSLRTPSSATMMSSPHQTTTLSTDAVQISDHGPSDSANIDSSVNEKAIGTGLGGALAFLKERGELDRNVEWAGRTKDSRDSYFTKAMSGYKDVFTGGKTDDRLALDVEVALTRKDEHGRILTPKEAFRQLCHQFHGVKPSKNTQEKRAKQVRKELAQKMVATGAKEADMVEGLKAVQAVAAAPYVALSGTIRPGQSRDAVSGYATADRAEEMNRNDRRGEKGGGKNVKMPPPPPKTRG
jgi:U4/U6.U5 tri-snRNP-associated protein 1